MKLPPEAIEEMARRMTDVEKRNMIQQPSAVATSGGHGDSPKMVKLDSDAITRIRTEQASEGAEPVLAKRSRAVILNASSDGSGLHTVSANGKLWVWGVDVSSSAERAGISAGNIITAVGSVGNSVVPTAFASVGQQSPDEMLARLQRLQVELLEPAFPRTASRLPTGPRQVSIAVQVDVGPIVIVDTLEGQSLALEQPTTTAGKRTRGARISKRKKKEARATREAASKVAPAVAPGQPVTPPPPLPPPPPPINEPTREFHDALLHNISHALVILNDWREQIDLSAPMTLGQLFVVGQPARSVGESSPIVATMLQQLYTARVMGRSVTSAATKREADAVALKVLHQLVDFGADVSTPSSDGLPPVHYAVMMREMQLLNHLLQRNASSWAEKHQRYRSATLLLLLPNDSGRVKMAMELLDINSELRRSELRSAEEMVASGETSLPARLFSRLSHTLSAKQRLSRTLTNQLAAMTADDSRSIDGRTLSMIEAEWHRSFLAMLLLHSNSTAELVAAEDSFGRTAIHLAALGMQPELLDLMDLGKGGKVLRKQDMLGRTALHLAAMTGRQDTIATLLALANAAETNGGVRLKAIKDVTGLTYASLMPGRRLSRHLHSDKIRGSKLKELQRQAGWDTDSIDVRSWIDSVRKTSSADSDGSEEDLEDCEIDQLPPGPTSPQSFLQRYLSAGRPVRLVGAADDWPMRTSWTKHRFTAQLGHLQVAVSQVATPAAMKPTRYTSTILSLDEFIGVMALPFPWPK
jgi:ankyrin repeat protein